MRIRVLCFAGVRDAIGQGEFELSIEGARVQDALAMLEEEYPAFAEWKPRVRVAVNETYCSVDATLSDGDTLALIPPVSGG